MVSPDFQLLGDQREERRDPPETARDSDRLLGRETKHSDFESSLGVEVKQDHIEMWKGDFVNVTASMAAASTASPQRLPGIPG